jgi:hypothetical protein
LNEATLIPEIRISAGSARDRRDVQERGFASCQYKMTLSIFDPQEVTGAVTKVLG